MAEDFWRNAGLRCLVASAPDERENPALTTLANDICRQLMARDDYPTLGTLAYDAVVLGNINSAVRLIEHLFPGWGYQVGRPLTARKPCGWYSSVFREKRDGEVGVLAGMWPQDGRRQGSMVSQYANDPALALMAALCYALADNEVGASAIAA